MRRTLLALVLLVLGVAPRVGHAEGVDGALAALPEGTLLLSWCGSGCEGEAWRMLRVRRAVVADAGHDGAVVAVEADVLFAGRRPAGPFRLPRRAPCGGDPVDWQTEELGLAVKGLERVQMARAWVAAPRAPLRFTPLGAHVVPPDVAGAPAPQLDALAQKWVLACARAFATGQRKGAPTQPQLALNPAAEDVPLAPLPTSGEDAWVLADVGNLRTQPRADAPVMRQLRIHTRVRVLARSEGWVHVGIPTLRGMLSGHMAAALLGPAPQTVPALLADAETRAAAGDAAGSRDALERALALDPADAVLRRRVRDALVAAGLASRARPHEDQLAGKAPVLWAACVPAHPRMQAWGENMVVLLGRTVDGKFTALGGVPDQQAPAPELQQALAQVLVEPWWSLSPEGTAARLDPLQLQAARLVEGLYEERIGGLFWGAAVTLGTCAQQGTLYATNPLSPAESAAPAADKHVQSALQKRTAARVNTPAAPTVSALGAEAMVVRWPPQTQVDLLDARGAAVFACGSDASTISDASAQCHGVTAAVAKASGTTLVAPLFMENFESGGSSWTVEVRTFKAGRWSAFRFNLGFSQGC
jgi:hypothetical protein